MTNPMVFRVVTYNVHWGQGTDGEYDLERVANIIRVLNPDAVAIQEVHQNTDLFSEDQPAVLARLLGMHAYFVPTMDGYPSDPNSGGRYGNLILTRLTVNESCTHTYTPGLGYSMSQEPRGIQAVRIGNLWVINTHMGCDITGFEQSGMAKELVDFVHGLTTSNSCNSSTQAVVCGDMNAFAASPAGRFLASTWVDAWLAVQVKENTSQGYFSGCTMPAWLPFQRIDYVFLAGPSIKPISARVLNTDLGDNVHPSDHRPLIVDIAW